MEQKQACHSEWGLLQLRGQAPIMVGATIGASQLLWVACRTSNNLVHVFQDCHLVSVWRFPSDPVFLLFVPSSNDNPAGGSGDQRADSSRKVPEESLLVFTSDSGVWHLNLTNKGSTLKERPTKKRKETRSAEFQKLVPETLVQEGDGVSSVVAGARNRGSDVRPELSGLQYQWERVAVHTQARYSKKSQVKVVSEREFLCFAPAVSVAAYGPDDTVALLSRSGVLSFMNFDFSHPSGRTAFTWVYQESPQTRMKDPTCIMFISVKPEGDTATPRGNAATVSTKFFESMFGDIKSTNSVTGLLQGDRNGIVSACFLDPLEGGQRECCSRVLCDLAQAIVAMLVIPFNNSAGQNPEHTRLRGLSKAKDLPGDSLLIVGQLGRIILITGVKDKSNEVENGPFLPVTKSFSWRTQNKTSTAAQLAEKDLTFHEWDLSSEIASACMLGPYRLCYRSRSEVLYVDLYEAVRKSTVHVDNRKVEDFGPGRSHTGMLSSSKAVSSETLPHYSSTGLRKEQRMVKEELLPQIVPVADVVVAIVGRGIAGSSGASRPLVALTARGRLLGVEVSDYVSSPVPSSEIHLPRSWRSSRAQREGQVQDLLKAVATVAKCAEGIKSHISSINLALKEFATAFPFVYEICSNQTRREIRCPELSCVREAPGGKLSCFLSVAPLPSTLVSPKELSFTASALNAPSSYGFSPRLMKVSIRLHNKTHTTLSQYWSLLLKLQSLHVDPTDVVCYSSVINRGLGLAAGAHFSHDFFAEFPSTGRNPLLATIFLCHLHDPHQAIIGYKLPPCTLSLSRNNRSIIRMQTNSENIAKSPSMRAISDMGVSGPCSEDVMSARETAGSVCLLLSSYRVDLLSLFQSPPLAENLWTFHKMTDKFEQSEASCSRDHVLGTFSGKLFPSYLDDAKTGFSTDLRNLWQVLHLAGSTQKSMLWKVAQRSSSSVPDDGIVSVTLEHESARESKVMQILFQASSLLLGSLAREALVWRISEVDGPFHLQVHCREYNLDSDRVDAQGQIQAKTPGGLNEIVKRMQKVIRDWKSILISGDSAVFPSLLDDTGSVVEAVLNRYRAHREYYPSH